MIFKCIQNGEKIETLEFPKCPKIKLKYKTRFTSILDKKMNVEFNFLDGTKQKRDFERDEILIKHAARTIKKYSHCKEKLPEITEFLDKNLRPKIHEDDIFIGQFPLSFYSAVSGGIYKFSGQIEDFQFENDESD